MTYLEKLKITATTQPLKETGIIRAMHEGKIALVPLSLFFCLPTSFFDVIVVTINLNLNAYPFTLSIFTEVLTITITC